MSSHTVMAGMLCWATYQAYLATLHESGVARAAVMSSRGSGQRPQREDAIDEALAADGPWVPTDVR